MAVAAADLPAWHRTERRRNVAAAIAQQLTMRALHDETQGRMGNQHRNILLGTCRTEFHSDAQGPLRKECGNIPILDAAARPCCAT